MFQSSPTNGCKVFLKAISTPNGDEPFLVGKKTGMAENVRKSATSGKAGGLQKVEPLKAVRL
jgi:hypothetical protein